MPKLQIETTHELGVETARDRLGRLLEGVLAKYRDQIHNLEQTWEGDALNFRFAALGMKVAGQAVVQAKAVAVDLDLPFAALLFKGKIESEVRKALEKTLS
jgi:putative polyhydroxyalkanoate system protein